MVNPPFSIDALLAHMEMYCTSRTITASDPRVRYELKEVGIHYVIDSLPLASDERRDLKKAQSKKICIEQALETHMIPASYLRQVLEELPEALRLDGVAQQYIAVAKLFPDASPCNTPCALKYDEHLPMITFTPEDLGSRLLLSLANALMTIQITHSVNTREECRSIFIYGGQAIRDYLGASLILPKGDA